MLKEIVPESYGLWSISRGLSNHNQDYKNALSEADKIRQGAPYDGKGARSEQGLIYFVNFMADIAINELIFMADKLKLDKLNERMCKYIQYSPENIPTEFILLLPRLLMLGKIPKSEIHPILGCSERKARSVISKLKKLNLLKETHPSKQAPIQLNISSELLSFVLPYIVPHNK